MLERSFGGARRLAPLIAATALIAGCASADKNATTTVTAAASAGAGTASSTGSSMPGMNMGSAATSEAGMVVDGIRPIPTQTLTTSTWQGMKITAMAMTAVPFVIYNGTSMQMVKPNAHTSFHLMVELTDADTGVAIPYSTVWATISKSGKIVYDERQWPMIARYLGPHYGNDVSVPGAGTYQLSLLVSPPVSARHVEYQNVWLTPHRVNATFHWNGA